MRAVDGSRLARTHRALRVTLRLRQVDVSDEAGVGRWKVIKLEAGEIDDLTFGEVDRCFAALGARLKAYAEWRGAALDRLLDETHARLVAAVLAILHDLDWQTRVEVTFSEYGERGSIDILAWHAAARVLLVVEVKSEIAGVYTLLRPLGRKVRLAAKIAARDLDWRTSQPVGRVVVLPEDSTARRAGRATRRRTRQRSAGALARGQAVDPSAHRRARGHLVSVICRPGQHYAESVIHSARASPLAGQFHARLKPAETQPSRSRAAERPPEPRNVGHSDI